MTLTILEEKPSAEMAGRLEQFELLFTYPLGPTQRFRISHGNDYPLFFRAIGGGNSASFVAGDKRGEILGTLGAALRRVRLADGTLRVVAYVGDLKTRPGLDQGRTLVRLALEATRWCRARGALSAYGVVMDGTARLPADYSGRCGILPFSPIGKLGVFRIPVVTGQVMARPGFATSEADLQACRNDLLGDASAPLGGDARLRSLSPPEPLVLPDRSACGLLEDTRLAKRLFREDGSEMVSSHLSHFAYSTEQAGVRLIREALAQCAGKATALFVCVPYPDEAQFAALLADLPATPASATLFGAGLDLSNQRWNISSSEI